MRTRTLIVLKVENEYSPEDIKARMKVFADTYNSAFLFDSSDSDIIIIDRCDRSKKVLDGVFTSLWALLGGCSYYTDISVVPTTLLYSLDRAIIVTETTISNRSIYYDLLAKRLRPDMVKFWFIDEKKED